MLKKMTLLAMCLFCLPAFPAEETINLLTQYQTQLIALQPDNTPASSKININTATETELISLPGIGKVGAQLIIEYRINKPFKTIDDIQNVKRANGRRVVGDKTYEKIHDLISVK